MSTIFQSTLPARGATIFTPPISTPKLNFNPRSPHGERRGMAYFAIDALAISIHAPRTGSDDFLVIFRVACCISIHAPRTGSDAVEQRTNLGAGYFNPRSPHGERPFFSSNLLEWHTFQSTLPARGATLEDQ